MSNVVFYIVGALIFFGALMVTIMLHELGHMITAKKFGVTVTQYFLGFGRTLWSTQRGETEYGVKLIPLGGYVRIIGMFRPPLATESDATETSWARRLIYLARQREYSTIPLDTSDAKMFFHLSWWRKALVLLAGPCANFIIAFCLFIFCFGVIGQSISYIHPGYTQVAQVANCLEDGTGVSVTRCPTGVTSAATKAGIKKGDKIISFNGEKVRNWSQASSYIINHPGDKISIEVERGSHLLTLTTTLSATTRNGRRQGFLGVTAASTTHYYHRGALYTLSYMWDDIKLSGQAIGHFPNRFVNDVEAIGGKKRNINGFVSIVGGGEISGQILSQPSAIVSAKSKLYLMLMLIGAFNLFIGAFNLLPILPLDGGHIFGALYEAVRDRLRKSFHLPKQEPFDIARLLPIAYAFTVLLMVVGAVVILADIVSPISVPIS